MPLHVANWMADPRIRLLTKPERADLMDALAQSWMLGTAVPWMALPSPEYSQPLRDIFLLTWGQYLTVRLEHETAYERRATKATGAAKARWNQPKDAPSNAPSNAPSIDTGTCPTQGAPTPTPTSSLRSEPPQKQRRSAAKDGTTIVADFELTAERRTVATKTGIPTERVPLLFREFVNYWLAKPGKDARKLDWDRTWENRCIQVATRVGTPSPPSESMRFNRNSFAPVAPITRGQESVVVKPDPEFERRYREQAAKRAGGA